jgi:hypothetical protein
MLSRNFSTLEFVKRKDPFKSDKHEKGCIYQLVMLARAIVVYAPRLSGV